VNRRVFFLNGLAILCVVCGHAASWAEIAMFWWADTYRNVPAPNFDQMGSPSHWILVVVMQLTIFSVPAFLFASGCFVAYAGRGSSSGLSWKVVRVRLTNLLIPYVIWSVVLFFVDFLDGNVYSPVEYLTRFATGKADGYGVYFYVPLICQFYLLSPLIVRLARTRGRLLLVGTAIIQLSLVVISYLGFYDLLSPLLQLVRQFTPAWVCLHWVFYFALGVYCSFQMAAVKRWLERYKWILLAYVVILAVLVVFEPQAIIRSTGNERGHSPFLLSANLYSVALVLCLMAFDLPGQALNKLFRQAAGKTYGIYLLHSKILEFVARSIRYFTPQIIAISPLFLCILILLGASIPWLFMDAVARSPAKKLHRYLFG